MLVAAPVPPPRWSRALVASFALHVGVAGTLAAIALSQPVTPPEPQPIRVQLLRIAETPALAAVAAIVAPPVPTVAPLPKPRPVAPKPVAAPVPKPESAPVAKPVAPAPPVARAAPAAEPSAAVSAAGATSAAATSSAGLATGRSVAGSIDPIDLYMARVVALIRKHKRYPPLAKRRGIEGDLLLRLVVAADGSVEVAVIRSAGAGSALLEEGARAAVAAVTPLPPPPAGDLRFDVPVRFSLNE